MTYNATNKYLYEILEDYRDSENKDEIFQAFLKTIWGSKNKRSTYTKHISYTVFTDFSDSKIGHIFKEYQSIPYVYYKSTTNQKNYIDLIRQKINNLYSTMCDKSVCVNKEYMDLIKVPKSLYYRWISGEEFESDELKSLIQDSLNKSNNVKKNHAKTKLDITWRDYKTLIAGFLRKIFDNYIPLDEFEDKTKIVLDIDIWTEDNFIISYFCKSLSGYMKNYQKAYYGINRGRDLKIQRCKCGGLFIQNDKNNRFKCNLCNKYQPIETKTIVCIDCGKEVEVKAWNMKTCRCKECQKYYNRIYQKELMKKRRYK